MMYLKKAKWIWLKNDSEKDSYVEFYENFIQQSGKKTVCRISCDGDYTLFINGHYVSSRQYADYEHYKVYDEIDITTFLKKGANHLAILVWHFGEGTQKYIPADAGLIYEVAQDETILACSNEYTLCRKSLSYKSGYQKIITPQLGFSFLYDANQEDNWINGEIKNNFTSAGIVSKNCKFTPCPIEKIKPGKKSDMKMLKNQGNYYLIDLGQETIGIPVLEFTSEIAQTIRVEWGEDLNNGHVRRIIDMRDFSFEYIAKPGKNEYANYMLCIGARYLEVYAEETIDISYVGIRSWTYPVKTIKKILDNPLDQRIYDMCVNTLKLCMNEHYMDTPWREQNLYAFDARNQMLCGYYAFEGKNAAYARSNLKLISEDRREDGLLSITYPCGVDLTIPSFSLYYFMAVNEYMNYTGDVSLGREVYLKLLSIIDAFMKKRKNGLIYKFEGTNHWNFYDWSEYLDGNLGGIEESVPDLMINCLFILALKSMQNITKTVEGRVCAYQDMIEESISATKKAFYNAERGMFSMTKNGSEYTMLGNALAVIAGITTKEESANICECIAERQLSECSLSMKTFVYDALLSENKEKYAETVLDEIRRDYGKMLQQGATTVWETIDGAAAFDGAGSLCHGWSAIPVYYYNLLFVSK